jgi:hypothetical protein
MLNRRRKKVLVAVALFASLLTMVVCWRVFGGEEVPTLQSQYESIRIGMTIEEAEAIIGIPSGTYDFNADTAPKVIQQESNDEPVGAQVNYYESGNSGILLSYDLNTRRISRKKLWLFERVTDPKKGTRIIIRKLKSVVFG